MTSYLGLETGGGRLFLESGIGVRFFQLEDPPVITIPTAPTIGVATASNSQVTLPFTPNSNGGSPVLDFTGTLNPGGIQITVTSSPCVFNGLTNGVSYSGTVHARNAIGNSLESSVSNSVTPSVGSTLVIYSNGVWNEALFPSGSPYDLSFSCTETPGYTTNPKPGHTKSLQLIFASPFGGGLQRASKWDLIPAVGVDLSAYTQLKLSILTPSVSSLYASDHYSRASGNDIGTATAATQNSSCWTGVTLNAWSDVVIPFSSLGRLSSFNYYKGNQPGSNLALTCQVDDIDFLSGPTGWIFRGRPTGLETGWTDASSASPNYSFLPNPTLNVNCYSINNAPDPAAQFTGSVTAGTLTISALLSGTVRIGDTLFYDAGTKGTISGGSGLSWTISGSPGNRASVNMASSTAPGIIPVVAMTPSAANQLWKVTHAGFNISQYNYFTFGAICPTAGHTYQVQIYDPFGAAIGSPINMSSTYTLFDFGNSSASWTVYNIPWGAFGSIGSVIGGISIKQSLNNPWYLSALGVWA